LIQAVISEASLTQGGIEEGQSSEHSESGPSDAYSNQVSSKFRYEIRHIGLDSAPFLLLGLGHLQARSPTPIIEKHCSPR
jgi:hypothetical protein